MSVEKASELLGNILEDILLGLSYLEMRNHWLKIIKNGV